MKLFLICIAAILRIGDQFHTISEAHPVSTHLLLKATYRTVEGSDPEYGQGAIEKQDLAHREIVSMVWLVEVTSPADPVEWQRRLNEGVDRRHGSFEVSMPSAEEQRKVDSGEITLQK